MERLGKRSELESERGLIRVGSVRRRTREMSCDG